MTSSPMPSAPAAVAAASAFATLNWPPRGSVPVAPPTEAAAGRPHHQGLRAGQAERDDRDGRGVGELAAVDVVDVDDTHGRPIRGEEVGLGGEVALDGAVEIEVVAQVREDGDRNRAVHPVSARDEIIATARRPDSAISASRACSWALGGSEPVSVPITPVGSPALEDGSQQVAGRRLPVRAGDTHDRHPVRGAVPEGGGERD